MVFGFFFQSVFAGFELDVLAEYFSSVCFEYVEKRLVAVGYGVGQLVDRGVAFTFHVY